MKILNYKKNKVYYRAIETDKGLLKIPADKEGTEKSKPLTEEDVSKFQKLLENSEVHEYLNEADLEIGPCVVAPSKIICVGLNYQRHAKESNMEAPKYPVLFNKFNNTLVDYRKDIPLGDVGVEFDYEVELGVVIGKTCKNVSESEALDYVLGYCVANDLSCRDLQFKTPQWLLGKSLDKFLPLGKYLVTKDEVQDCQQLKLSSYLNEELRQNSNTGDMIFSVPEIIAFISQHMSLEPGDLILTGTPEGVIMGMKEKKWLKPGDTVKVEIEKLGSTTNTMV